MRICLVGVTHPCHNPRLVREADSLAELGHDVRVVAPSTMAELAEKDRRLMGRRRWRLETVNCQVGHGHTTGRTLLVRGRRWLARRAYRSVRTRWVAERAYTLALPELATQALAEPPDWVIAHAHAALPVAARVAAWCRARLGFDCEDLLVEHGSELVDIVRSIERRYLRLCSYISVPSRRIAERLAEAYDDIPEPVVLYNVFPMHLASPLTPPRQRRPSPVLRLHWFGQTIGPGRGIEEAIEALALLGPDAELHLRGHTAEGYRAAVDALARRYDVHERVIIHRPVDHDDLVASMDQFGVGLALERPDHGNYSRTVTNKIFAYLLAGLAVAATDTPGQREVLQAAPSAGFLYRAGDARSLAVHLQGWIADPSALRAAQHAAWTAARGRFCWELEQDKLLAKLGAHTIGSAVPSIALEAR